MAQMSLGRRMPKGYIYKDKSSKGGKYRHNRWCAEIYFANVHFRKRSCDREVVERWLKQDQAIIYDGLIVWSGESSTESICEAIRELKRSNR